MRGDSARFNTIEYRNDSSTNSYIKFLVHNGNTSGTVQTEVLRLKGNGNVGIGVEPSNSYKLDVNGNAHLDYSLIGRGFRAANRGEFHLNATNENDVTEMVFGYGDGFTESKMRWVLSDRGKANGELIMYAGPANGGFLECQTWKKLATYQ